MECKAQGFRPLPGFLSSQCRQRLHDRQDIRPFPSPSGVSIFSINFEDLVYEAADSFRPLPGFLSSQWSLRNGV